MTEDLLAAVRAHSDACERLNAVETEVNPRPSALERHEAVNDWQATRDELVEAAQQWAAHYG